MKKIFFILSMIIIFALPAFAGELYSCKDRAGNTIVTSTPQDDMTDCALKDESIEPTPEEKTKERKETRQQSEYSKTENYHKCRQVCINDAKPCTKSCYDYSKLYNQSTKEWEKCQSRCNSTERQCDTDCRKANSLNY